ncbi:hypothetical protein LZQ00_08420 [Sphingobacterium sp. SRCM116780]|uniref:hypothetical protein n=1 Tax=Sphingobacterium sp. SRCM116780 TaxID=2907623 RepID=UPI001F1C6A43|nr:hypothetical protein [Sphingobacterium sp. SRCM116780]UIR57832.1 hypothetical protein LZQ00_08420 [Sphingobacterium sp. SRCM116780]
MIKLEEIINAVRGKTINDLLGDDLATKHLKEILIYAQYSINADTDYKFFYSKKGFGEIIVENNIPYERLCSLEALTKLINFYLAAYDKKTDDVLVIDIIDHLDTESN